MAGKKISELDTKFPLDGTEYVPVADNISGIAYKAFQSSIVYAGIGANYVFPVNGSFAYQPTNVTLSGNTNNLGIGANALVRIQSTGNYDLTGIIPLTTAETNYGRILYIVNRGTNNISLRNEDALSTAENRFMTHNGSHITLGPNHLVLAMYDGAISRWRIWDLT